MSFSNQKSSQGSNDMSMMMMQQQTTPRGPSEGMNNGVHHQRPQSLQIYTAVYSGVSVYEMEVNLVAVMRRRSDSWLNATQILKVAGVEKGKRTKVLEKEILVGEHEKVQGGYGKYQGTWINYQRGVEFCRQYGVEELLRPLLEYDMGQDGINAAGSGGVDTPTKEQAMAAQRKKLYNTGIDKKANAQSANGTFFKNISSTASNAVAAMNKARFDSPVPRPGSGHRHPAGLQRANSYQMGSQESSFPGGSQQSMQSVVSEGSFVNGHMDSAYSTQSNPYFATMQEPIRNGDADEPPRKRVRPSPSLDTMQVREAGLDLSMRDATPTEPNESFLYQQMSQPEDVGVMALDPLPQPNGKGAERKVRLLTSLFLDPYQSDFSTHPALLGLAPQDLDLPLDGTAHTALHWAATLARLPLLRALIGRGASIFRVNGGGETALIRACVVTNNLDNGSFPELLELLGPTIEMTDGRGRTVLHHIAVSSAVKGRNAASRYYLESLLEFVVRQGSSNASSQQKSFNGLSPAPITMKAIGLARFMSEIVNAQDKVGDTALNIAARIGNRSIIQQLLEVGADASIPNRAGLKPLDFGVGGEAEVREHQATKAVNVIKSPERVISRVVGETSQDIISSMSSLLSETEMEFAKEMRAKQDLIDRTHAQLRECSALLRVERETLNALEQKREERRKRREKIDNLQRTSQAMKQHLAVTQPKIEHEHGGMVNGDSTASVADPDLTQVGDADAPWHLDLGDGLSPNDLADAVTYNTLRVENLSPDQIAHITHALPSTATLNARIAAYRQNNVTLRQRATQLKSCSSELEEKYRKVIMLCTGVGDAEIEQLLEGLVSAVGSEGGVGGPDDVRMNGMSGGGNGIGGIGAMDGDANMGKWREILRRIEDAEGTV
ncbi:MAG: transcriptional regulator swi6 [Caeruleum heppii]|nr:MAG: transcriptional regulator swi6 [Caeruleum heppii]